MKRSLFPLLALSVLSVVISAQTQKTTILQRASFAPRLTGTLTNIAWRDATVFTKFHTVRPGPGLKPSERTAAYVLIDNDNLYVGLRMDDRHPDEITAGSSERGKPEKDDWIQVSIDTSESHSAGVYFLATPTGVQTDGTLDSAGMRHPTSNRTWTCVSKQTKSGWIAEFSIPLKTIPLDPTKEQSIGLNFTRYYSHGSREDEGPSSYASGVTPLAEFQQVLNKPAQ